MKYLSEFRKRNGQILSQDEFNVFILGGLDVDERDKQGNTYIHLFIMSGDLEAVKLLCDSGANLELKNKIGKKPIESAFEKFKEFPSDRIKKIVDVISSRLIENRCDKEIGFKKIAIGT